MQEIIEGARCGKPHGGAQVEVQSQKRTTNRPQSQINKDASAAHQREPNRLPEPGGLRIR